MEYDIDPIISSIKGTCRECGGAGVGVDAVDGAVGVARCLQRRAVHGSDGGIRPHRRGGIEVRAVSRVVPVRREVGRDVGGVRIYGHWLREVHPLPAGGRLVGEGGAGQQLPGRGPQFADMRPGVSAGLVEADPGHGAGDARLEFDAHVDRGRVVGVNHFRGDVGSPDRARAGHVDRVSLSRVPPVAAIIDGPGIDRITRVPVGDPRITPGDGGACRRHRRRRVPGAAVGGYLDPGDHAAACVGRSPADSDGRTVREGGTLRG